MTPQGLYSWSRPPNPPGAEWEWHEACRALASLKALNESRVEFLLFSGEMEKQDKLLAPLYAVGAELEVFENYLGREWRRL